MANFQDYADALKGGLQSLVSETLKTYSQQATADAQAFLDTQKASLDTWTQQLASGALSREDFSDLLQGVKDLAELVALKQAGLAAAKLDQFRTSLVNLLIDTAFKIFLP